MASFCECRSLIGAIEFDGMTRVQSAVWWSPKWWTQSLFYSHSANAVGDVAVVRVSQLDSPVLKSSGVAVLKGRTTDGDCLVKRRCERERYWKLE